jgi:hypothetical protein
LAVELEQLLVERRTTLFHLKVERQTTLVELKRVLV